jgi:hypothetical protein
MKVIVCLVILKALYTPVPDTNPEYAQGAIERNDLAHREIARNVWLIRVPDPGDPNEWQQRLNDAVDAKHGAFHVVHASADEEKKVESGEVTLQK